MRWHTLLHGRRLIIRLPDSKAAKHGETMQNDIFPSGLVKFDARGAWLSYLPGSTQALLYSGIIVSNIYIYKYISYIDVPLRTLFGDPTSVNLLYWAPHLYKAVSFGSITIHSWLSCPRKGWGCQLTANFARLTDDGAWWGVMLHHVTKIS